MMDDSFINSSNMSEVATFLLKLDDRAVRQDLQPNAQALAKSLQLALQAYHQTQANFSRGESAINIVDHYANALVSIAKAIYVSLNEETQQRLKQILAESAVINKSEIQK